MTAIPPAIVEALKAVPVCGCKPCQEKVAALVAAIADALDGLREERDEALLEIQRLSVEYQDTLDEERKRMWR